MKFFRFHAFAWAAYAAAAPQLVTRTTTTCYDGVYIIVARGTFESQDYVGYGLQGTLVTSILNAIPNSNASAIIYPASVVNYGQSVGQGASNAQQQITSYHNACPGSRMVLLGYSQGAQVVGNALAGGSSGIPVLGGITDANNAISPAITANVVAINLLGDPNHTLGQGKESDPASCSTGSSTPRTGSDFDNMQHYSDRLNEWCHDGDPVCCINSSDPGSHLGYLLSQDNINAMTAFIVEKYLASLA